MIIYESFWRNLQSIMTQFIVLGIRVPKDDYKRVRIENVDLNAEVRHIREHAITHAQRSGDYLNLVYCGTALRDDRTLSSYGIQAGRTIHVLERDFPRKSSALTIIRMPSDAVLQSFVETFTEFGQRAILQKFSKDEVNEKLLHAVPRLRTDPAAVAFLMDPELLMLLANRTVLGKALREHPLLIETLPHILTYLRKHRTSPPPPVTNATTSTTNNASTSTGYSYSLEALSDEEDMEEGESQARRGQQLTRNSSYNAITAAQLAAAIANATANFGGDAEDTPPASAGVITNEMFGSALQQAFANATSNSDEPATSTATSSTAANTPPSEVPAELESVRERLAPQLRQMREMGLMNERQNMQALEVTAGDVQAAIEFVFNSDLDMNY